MTATNVRVQMQQRSDTAANWTAAGPILLAGEIGYETDTGKFKIGDGTTAWGSLDYLPIPDGSGNLTIAGNLEIGATGTLTFEGSTANDFETTLAVTDPTADRTITLPDVSGTVVTTGDTGSVTSTMIADGTIVDGDVNASAAIAGTKISPDFGSQNVTTTGTSTAASFIPTSSSAPTNGVYLPAANSVALSVNGAERARIDSFGRLLVGTSTSRDFTNYIGGSYEALLQIEAEGDTGSSVSLSTFRSNNTGVPQLVLQKGGGTKTSPTAVTSTYVLGSVVFNGYDGTSFVNAAAITASVDGTPAGPTPGPVSMPGRLVFSTTSDGASSPTERMRITNDGQIWTGNTASLGAAKIQSVSDSATAAYLAYTTSATSRTHFRFINPNGEVGSITTSASATAYNTSSDYRLKENVTPVTDGITRLQQLKPSRFNFIADPDKTVDGFLAHEVQAIVPEAITGEKDAVDDDGNPQYQGIDQSKIVPLVVAALQEAIAKIETLEQRLNDAGIN